MKKLLLMLGMILFVTSCKRILPEEIVYEIYTPKNIYYIKGLELTNEVNDTKIVFKTEEELARYLAHISAIDIENYF